MSRVDGDTRHFEMGYGSLVPLCPTQWRCIFGILAARKDLPRWVTDGGFSIREKITISIKDLYGVKCKNGRFRISVDMAAEKNSKNACNYEEGSRSFYYCFLGCNVWGAVMPH